MNRLQYPPIPRQLLVSLFLLLLFVGKELGRVEGWSLYLPRRYDHHPRWKKSLSSEGFRRSSKLHAKSKDQNTDRGDVNNNASGSNDKLGGDRFSRQLFSVTEVFGKLTNSKSNSVEETKRPPKIGKMSLKKVALVIKREYEAIFWATGNMDTALWKDDCTFADPFSSFGGPGATKRFKTNADNLGKFVLDPSLKVTSFDVDEKEYIVSVGWVFNSKLKLPWRPVLAAAGTTLHYIEQDSGLIYRYEEKWKSKPWDVIKRLFKSTL